MVSDYRRLPIIAAVVVGTWPVDQLQEREEEHCHLMPITLAQILDLLGQVFDVELLPRLGPQRLSLLLRSGVKVRVV
jgi:hypothetical protein